MSADDKTAIMATMTPVDEKNMTSTTDFLTITRPSPTHKLSGDAQILSTIDDVDSTHSRSPTPSTRLGKSMDGQASFSAESKQNISHHPSFDRDLEAQAFTMQQSQACASKTGLLPKKTRCDPAWPDLKELKMKQKALKRERACCACWGGLNKTMRRILSTLIIFLVLGAGLGVGIGISKRVGGGVVNTKGNNSPLPGT